MKKKKELAQGVEGGKRVKIIFERQLFKAQSVFMIEIDTELLSTVETSTDFWRDPIGCK